MKNSLLCLLLLFSFRVVAQPVHYTSANIHSHNDYKQKVPFDIAYNNEVGSMEADIYLQDGKLLVAHEPDELDTSKSLEKIYLDRLQAKVRSNAGHVYADPTRKLILLVDIKTEAVPALQQLIKVLQQYPSLTRCRQLQFVISGNRPADNEFVDYPDYIFFDGLPGKKYSQQALKKIGMVSADFAGFTAWNGTADLPPSDREKLRMTINKIHALKKPVRFWNAPDKENAWQQLESLKVDFINTDHIEALRRFLDATK